MTYPPIPECLVCGNEDLVRACATGRRAWCPCCGTLHTKRRDGRPDVHVPQCTERTPEGQRVLWPGGIRLVFRQRGWRLDYDVRPW